jgi:glycosyltransferase involved in cell wall biosynthesis
VDAIMKILQLHNTQLFRGGADIELEREAEGLRERGHAVETMLVDNHEIEEIGSARAALKSIWNQEAFAGTGRWIRDFTPDVVHVHTPFPLMSPSVFVAASRSGVPVVATSHSFRYSCVMANLRREGNICEDCVGRRIKYPAVVHRCYKGSLPGSVAMSTSLAVHRGARTFANRVDRFIAPTNFMRETIIAEGISPDRVVVVPHSTPDPGLVNRTPNGSAVFIGRFGEEKGILTLLDAWRKLKDQIPLVIAGDGALREVIEEAARHDHRISVLPWQDPTEVVDLIGQAEVVIVPSEVYEGFGLVAIEAFAASTPVIASETANSAGVITPGRDGEVFRSGDAGELTRAVERFFGQADRSSYRQNARARYDKDFRPDRQFDRLESIYLELVGRRS